MAQLIRSYNDTYAYEHDKAVYIYQSADINPREFNTEQTDDSLNWDITNYIGDFLVLPYGDYNNLPEVIREVVHKNYIAPGILKKKAQLLWGKGPKLYTEVIQNGELKREWLDDKEIQSWLDGFEYEDYLLKCNVDFNTIEGTFTKFRRNRGGRIGKRFISALEHIPTNRARAAKKKDNTRINPTHIIETDWSFTDLNSINKAVAYNIFNPKDPFQYATSIYYSNMYSFCTDYYTVPDIYGSLEWLRRSTDIPKILKHMSDNTMNIKFHIQSPAGFWEEKKEMLKAKADADNKSYHPKMLQEYKQDFFTQVTEVLSGIQNVGKFLHTEKVINVDGANIIEQGWDIKPIDMKIKDYVDSQIAISNRADRAVSGGIGLHGALGNVNESARSNSGSEQIYALKNYLQTGIDIPEMIVTKPINLAIRANFPGKNIKLGFYHDQAKAEQEETPSNREINQ